jgi:hypothetical protein
MWCASGCSNALVAVPSGASMSASTFSGRRRDLETRFTSDSRARKSTNDHAEPKRKTDRAGHARN